MTRKLSYYSVNFMRACFISFIAIFAGHTVGAQESEIVHYPNGNKMNEHVIRDGKQYFYQVWDVHGNELLINGTGSSFEVDSSNNISIYEEYKDSLKVIWYEIRHVERDTIFWKSDVPAIYVKGEYQFYKDIELYQKRYVDVLKLKKTLKKEGGGLRVFVLFIIDKEGNVSEVKVTNPKYQHMSNSHETIVKQLTGWRPAIYKGENVKFQYILPFSY